VHHETIQRGQLSRSPLGSTHNCKSEGELLMTIMKVNSPEDLEKWKKAIAFLESLIPFVEQDEKFVRNFYSMELESAKFWKRYAFERTNDIKLREIATNDLQLVLNYETQLDSLLPVSLRGVIDLFQKEFSVTT
jgi:hypothetical protein